MIVYVENVPQRSPGFFSGLCSCSSMDGKRSLGPIPGYPGRMLKKLQPSYLS